MDYYDVMMALNQGSYNFSSKFWPLQQWNTIQFNSIQLQTGLIASLQFPSIAITKNFYLQYYFKKSSGLRITFSEAEDYGPGKAIHRIMLSALLEYLSDENKGKFKSVCLI